MMKFTYKQTMLFSVLAFSFLTSTNIMPSASPLSAEFTIVKTWGQSYEATINVMNNGSTKIVGWQLDFNFSSDDQKIIRTWNGGVATSLVNPVTIVNDNKHVTIKPNESRTVKIHVSKNSSTTVAIPSVIATVTGKNASNSPAEVSA